MDVGRKSLCAFYVTKKIAIQIFKNYPYPLITLLQVGILLQFLPPQFLS